MGANILAIGTVHHRDIGALATDLGKEGVCLGIDRIDHLLAGPFPFTTAKVSNTFMRVIAGLLVDAGNLNVCHALVFLM